MHLQLYFGNVINNSEFIIHRAEVLLKTLCNILPECAYIFYTLGIDKVCGVLQLGALVKIYCFFLLQMHSRYGRYVNDTLTMHECCANDA